MVSASMSVDRDTRITDVFSVTFSLARASTTEPRRRTSASGQMVFAQRVLSIVSDHRAITEPVRQIDNGSADVTGPYDKDGVWWHVGLQIDLNFASADTGVPTAGFEQ